MAKPQPPVVVNRQEGREIATTSPIPALFPGGGVTMFSGATGVGKTAFIAKLVKAIIDGKGTVLGAEVQPTCPKVGLICTDRNWEKSQYWYKLAGVEEGEKFQAYCLQDDFKINWTHFADASKHMTLLKGYLDLLALPPHSVVVIDPISPFLGTTLGDYSKTFAAISPINQEMAKRQLTALGLGHVMKMKGDPKDQFLRMQDRNLGSTAIASYTDTQIYLIGPEEQRDEKGQKVPWYTVGYVPHNAKSDEFKFGRDENGLFIPWEECLAAKAKTNASAADVTSIDGTDEQLAELLSLFPTVGPIQAGALNTKAEAFYTARGETRSKKTYERWRDELVKRGEVYKPKHGSYMRETSRPKEEEAVEAK